MFNAILTFLGDGIAGVFGLLTTAFGAAIGIFWDGTAITEIGELLLLGAIVGLAFFALKWVRSMIPFLK